jgi:hypothetical protein
MAVRLLPCKEIQSHLWSTLKILFPFWLVWPMTHSESIKNIGLIYRVTLLLQ